VNVGDLLDYPDVQKTIREQMGMLLTIKDRAKELIFCKDACSPFIQCNDCEKWDALWVELRRWEAQFIPPDEGEEELKKWQALGHDIFPWKTQPG
jgi:hypothetical protein